MAALPLTALLLLLSLISLASGSSFKLTSKAFGDGDTIPSEYLKDDDNISPPLEFEDAPPGTKTFAIIVDDVDAVKGEGTHWIVYNIPEENPVIEEEVSNAAHVTHG